MVIPYAITFYKHTKASCTLVSARLVGSGEVACLAGCAPERCLWQSKRGGKQVPWSARSEPALSGEASAGHHKRSKAIHPPVAVPCVRLGDKTPALHTDRCHSLRSLYPPLAALPSLPPVAFFGYFLGETRKYRPRQGPEVRNRRLPQPVCALVSQ